MLDIFNKSHRYIAIISILKGRFEVVGAEVVGVEVVRAEVVGAEVVPLLPR